MVQSKISQLLNQLQNARYIAVSHGHPKGIYVGVIWNRDNIKVTCATKEFARKAADVLGVK